MRCAARPIAGRSTTAPTFPTISRSTERPALRGRQRWPSSRYHAIRRPPLLPTAILGAALLAAACGTTAGPLPEVGNRAPSISGTALDGSAVSLAGLAGHPVVVNFWASWCVPCRDEFPIFRQELAALGPTDGLAVVGVLFKDETDLAKAFATDFGATWPTVTDPDGTIAAGYRITAPPQTFFIDRTGVIRAIQVGELTAQEFATQYAKIKP